MLIKGESSASLSFFCSLSLSLLPSLKNTQGKSVYSYSLSLPFSLLPLKNIEHKSIYSYSLSPSLSPPPLSEGSILIEYIEEAYRGKEAYKRREAYRGREVHRGREAYRRREHRGRKAYREKGST